MKNFRICIKNREVKGRNVKEIRVCDKSGYRVVKIINGSPRRTIEAALREIERGE